MFNEEEWQLMTDNLPLGVLIIKADGFKPIYCNKVITFITGYKLEDFADISILDLVLDSEKDELIDILTSDNNSSANIKVNTKNKSVMYCTVYVNRFYINESLIYLSFLDITPTVLQSQLLENSNIILKNFARITSHDLKSPLISLTSLAEVVVTELNNLNFLLNDYNKLEDNLSEKEILKIDIKNICNKLRKLSLMIKDSASEMTKTVENSLKYSESEYIESSVFNINIAINGAKKNLKAKRHNLDKKITYNISPLCEIKADLEKMVLVFQNLFSNAIKFNDKSEVIIDVWNEKKEDKIIIYVKDNGMGIKKSDLGKIFLLYKRLNGSKIEGSGLGLSIVERIIKSHQGEIEVLSEYGVSTTFKIILPNLLNK